MPSINYTPQPLLTNINIMVGSKSNRVESIDILKGLVMILMALDHTRDYFHAYSFVHDPTDPLNTTIPIYFTRWITHFCAPAFAFLAGLSAFFIGRRKSKKELRIFLIKRGLWLVFIELTIVNFAWFFDVRFLNPSLMVIWSLGISMILLSILIYIPRKTLLAFSILMIAGHNLLDTVHFENSVLWSIIHEFGFFTIFGDYNLMVGYPLIPWIGVMSLGFTFGTYYDVGYSQYQRVRLFNRFGIISILLFFFIRGANVYGDLIAWSSYGSFTQTAMSFLNPTKYPPSLSYLLMTLAGTFLFLAQSENWKGKAFDVIKTFGRVPFFYYIIHLYFIHTLALVAAQLTGFGWKSMILHQWVTDTPALEGYGFNLITTYLVWVALIVILYPICFRFDAFKQSHKHIWWLSYL